MGRGGAQSLPQPLHKHRDHPPPQPRNPARVRDADARGQVHGIQHNRPIPIPQVAGQGHRLRESALLARDDLEAVDDDLDRMLLVLFEADLRPGEPDLDPIDHEPSVTGFPQAVEDVPVLALHRAHHGRDQVDPPAVRTGGHGRRDPVDGLRGDLLTVVGAVRDPDAGIEETQVVVDLGHGADRGTRVATPGALFDRDRRRESLDRVDVRLVHLAQELAGVRGEALDVPTLALRVEGVEGEGRLSGPAHAGDDDELPAREVDRDVLEIVLTSAADADRVGRFGHVRRPPTPEGARPPSPRGATARAPGPAVRARPRPCACRP